MHKNELRKKKIIIMGMTISDDGDGFTYKRLDTANVFGRCVNDIRQCSKGLKGFCNLH